MLPWSPYRCLMSCRFVHECMVVCRYDFNHPEAIPESLHHAFDCVVIDPPFITREVWEKYTAAAKLLLVKEPEGKLSLDLCSRNGNFNFHDGRLKCLSNY